MEFYSTEPRSGANAGSRPVHGADARGDGAVIVEEVVSTEGGFFGSWTDGRRWWSGVGARGQWVLLLALVSGVWAIVGGWGVLLQLAVVVHAGCRLNVCPPRSERMLLIASVGVTLVTLAALAFCAAVSSVPSFDIAMICAGSQPGRHGLSVC